MLCTSCFQGLLFYDKKENKKKSENAAWASLLKYNVYK